MENALMRTRVGHQSFKTTKKRITTEKLSLRERIGLQIAICILILLMAGIIKNANTSATNYLSEQIKSIVSYEVEISTIAEYGKDIFEKIFTTNEKGDTHINDEIGANNPIDGQSGKSSLDIAQGTKELNAQNTSSQDIAGVANNQASASGTQAKAGTNQAVVPQSQTKPSSTPLYKGIFITPVEGHVGAPFGEVIDPLKQTVKVNKGLYIEADKGASIKAAAAGLILEAAYDKTLGNYIKIEHSNGMYTLYAQCSQLLVKKGQKVTQGEAIAKVGNLAADVGAHLHFEIWKDGKAVNPLDYISVPEK